MTTLGDTLKEARSKKGLKLPVVAEQTGVPLKKLQALEQNRWADIPDDVYARGAIRNYALLVDVDPNLAMTLYRQARPEPEPVALMSQTQTRRAIALIPATITSLVLVAIVLIALFALHIL